MFFTDRFYETLKNEIRFKNQMYCLDQLDDIADQTYHRFPCLVTNANQPKHVLTT